MTAIAPRRLLAVALLALAMIASLQLAGLTPSAHAQQAPTTLNLETLTASEVEAMLQSGELTSVELVKAYKARIEAINKSGPGSTWSRS